MDLVALGLQIRRYRRKRGLSFTDLKNRTGISVVNLKEYEDGQKEPAMWELIRLAEALDVLVSELSQGRK